jgi:carbon storage regulator
MLYLVRKLDESIIVNNDIEINVVEIKRNSVKLGITFPKTASVLRKEIHDRIMSENRAALAINPEDFVALEGTEQLSPATEGNPDQNFDNDN